MGGCCRFGVIPHSCNTWCFATHRAASVVPTYDDVSCLVDGLHRLKAFDVAGFRGLFRSLAIEPAHAPLTTITATIGFALTPGEPLGTYALGGVWVILFLALAAILLKEVPRLGPVLN
jgi:hypothetical protein